ncbi:hypothetical protein [Spirillospora sp. CA-128828]|uniref:hypothetical protein n=1 Tax=Spirillospora sp. CA-128828 TaxID=3240033 RepID=UPI003D8F4D86
MTDRAELGRRYTALEAQLHTERRGRLAAEAAVRRALQHLDQFIHFDLVGDLAPGLREALTIEQPKETR